MEGGGVKKKNKKQCFLMYGTSQYNYWFVTNNLVGTDVSKAHHTGLPVILLAKMKIKYI